MFACVLGATLPNPSVPNPVPIEVCTGLCIIMFEAAVSDPDKKCDPEFTIKEPVILSEDPEIVIEPERSNEPVNLIDPVIWASPFLIPFQVEAGTPVRFEPSP